MKKAKIKAKAVPKPRKTGGRAPTHASGVMSVVTVRLPPALRDRVDYAYRNDVHFPSKSAVIVACIEAHLPSVEQALRLARGIPL